MTHFCTQKSCISKCLWWISCSNFEPFSRIFNAQTSTKTWVGTCAHKQQLLCHSSMNSYIYLWIPRDTHGFPQTPMESQGAMQISLALLPSPCSAGALCQCLTGAWASEQVCRVRLCHLNCKTCLRIWAEVMTANSSVFGGTKLHPYRWYQLTEFEFRY